MATIAFAGNGTDRFYDCCYYILTEAGDLWYMTLRTASGEYRISYEKLGSVGLNLTGVSTVTGGMYASMTYDPDTGYLLLSRLSLIHICSVPMARSIRAVTAVYSAFKPSR